MPGIIQRPALPPSYLPPRQLSHRFQKIRPQGIPRGLYRMRTTPSREKSHSPKVIWTRLHSAMRKEIEPPDPDYHPTKQQIVDLKIVHDSSVHPTPSDLARMIK